jgi:ATP-binding cassette, subfamily B, bacterial CvaB/MchF/RaxB
VSLLDFGGRQRLPLILQSEAAECGLACLAMVASYHGHRTDLNALRRRYPVSMNGMTLRALMQIAGYLQLSCRACASSSRTLSQLTSRPSSTGT